MKKFWSVCCLFVFSILLPSTELANAEGESVVVSSIQGSPMVIRAGRAIPATVGMACVQDDVLSTNENCGMDVSMNGLAGCRVLPSSRCLIAASDQGLMKIRVENGNAILNLEKLPQGTGFELETPTAIASVRGTQFWGRVDLQKAENPITTFAVRRGTVEIFAKSVQKKFTLEEGQALDIAKDSTAAPAIRPALPGELKAMEQAPSIKTST